ncbi:MAG: alcohol dehydrogenase (cytochrome c) [Gammaproteobacteria bacterium]|jgi:alcohol dehydrogenase (cytochrome c)
MSGLGQTIVGVIVGAALGAGVLYTIWEDKPSSDPVPVAVHAAAPVPAAPIDTEELGAEISLGSVGNHWPAKEPIDNGAGPVTAEMLNSAASTDTQWLHYGGDYRGFRHSGLNSLNPDSVKNLKVAWAFPTGTTGQFEVSPVVHDGVMFVTTSYNRLFALDAKNGALLWRYDHQQPKNLRLCCGPANRGVAITGDLVLMGTLDARLIAFDRRTGEIRWDTEVAPYIDGFSLTSAPLIVGDLAVTGIAGGEYGTRGFFDAYNINTGERVWRHYTVPDDGEPGVETWAGDSYKRGGAPAWTTGAYDAETDTLFWTTGNPSPDWNGSERAGDNLYSNSLLALDPKTGERKWHFQFTPHDVWDYDGNTHIFLVDVEIDGEPVKAVAQANRNGYFYLIERSTGKFLRANAYVEQVNWATIDSDGRPIVDATKKPTDEPTERVCPSNMGGINGAWTGAYNPDLGLVYVGAVEACQHYQSGISGFVKGMPYLGGMPVPVDVTAGKAYGHMTAIDAATGEIKWRYLDRNPMMAGALSTAGGVVLTGNQEGFALALDAESGDLLWNFRMGGVVRSQPIAYELNGESYVAIGSGGWANMALLTGGPTNIPDGGHLFVFKVPQ